jgi:hypothetical protein
MTSELVDIIINMRLHYLPQEMLRMDKKYIEKKLEDIKKDKSTPFQKSSKTESKHQ